MRFQRSDLPGILIAVLAPVVAFVLFAEAWEVWDHHDSPLLGAVSVNLAVGAGLIGAFSRFIRNWDAVLSIAGLLVLIVFGVIALQRTGNDGTAFATTLKLAGVGAFLLLNLVILYQLVTHGLLPVLDRRDARKRAEAEAEAGS